MIVALLFWSVLACAWWIALPGDAPGRRWHLVHMALPGAVLALAMLAPPLGPPLLAALTAGAATLAIALAGWTAGDRLGNHALMDIVYPLMALGTALAMILAAGGDRPGPWVALALMAIWAARLFTQMLGTNLHHEREPYASLRRKFGPRWRVWSFFAVYALQGVIVWLWCLPFAFATPAPGAASSTGLRATDWAGIAIWLIGFLFQAVGDRQLATFRSDPANRGRIMDKGLWALTRHPNYFGEAVMWWGYFLFALAHPWGWIGILAPLHATWFMGWGSATPGTERHMRKSRGADAWDAYAARVPRFIPWVRL